MDDVLVRLGETLPVFDVPPEGIEERIEELPAELRLVVLGGPVGVVVPVEPLHQLEDFLGRGHFMPIDPIIGDIGEKRLFVEE